MAQKRYEISDEQWNQLNDLFPVAKTGRPPMDNRLMFNAILWIARSELHGVTYLNALVRGKQYIAVFVSGVMTVFY